jgi:hypothetical protein
LERINGQSRFREKGEKGRLVVNDIEGDFALQKCGGPEYTAERAGSLLNR